MLQFFKRFFSVQYMIKPSAVLGELPSNKEAYRTNFNMAWPSALETVLVSLIASVDTIMVGVIGPAAIASVGITTQPKFIVLAVILSLNIGVTAVVARRKGEEDMEGANRCLKQAVMICTGLSLLMTVVAFSYAQQILIFAGAQSDVIADATIYFQIILIGNFFASIGLTINAAQRGVGNTKISMRTNLMANVINLIFNYFLINGIAFFPRLGVKGAAIATVLGNFVAFLMSIASVCHPDAFLSILREKDWRFDKRTISSIAKVASGAMVEQVFMRVGMFTYTKIVAGLGTIAFATHQICVNILNLSFSFGDGLGIASSSLVGQSLGAKRPDLATIYGKVGQRFALMVSSVLFVFFTLGGTLLVSLFSDDVQILALGAQIMDLIACICLVQTTTVVISGCLRGAGDIVFVAVASLLSITILRPIISWILCYSVGWGLVGAWIGLLIDQSIRCIFCYYRFSNGKWSKIQL